MSFINNKKVTIMYCLKGSCSLINISGCISVNIIIKECKMLFRFFPLNLRVYYSLEIKYELKVTYCDQKICPYKNCSCVCIKIQRIFYSKTAPDYEDSECWQWERNQPGSCYVRVICHLSNHYIWICHELPIQVWIKIECFIIIDSEEVFFSSL